jgi:hypothetical protein
MMPRRHGVRVRLVCAGAIAVVLGLAARASDKPSADYVTAMQTLKTVAEGLPKSLAAEDGGKAMDELVIAARPALSVLEKYWTARQVEDALQIAQKASKAIAEISVAVHLMTSGPNPLALEGAQESIKTFVATCSACHAAHREQLADGSYAIK